MTRTYEAHGCFDTQQDCLSKEYEASSLDEAVAMAKAELDAVFSTNLDGAYEMLNDEGDLTRMVNFVVRDKELVGAWEREALEETSSTRRHARHRRHR